METLARFRTAPAGSTVAQALDEIVVDSPDHTPFRTVPASWFRERKIGRALLAEGRYADIYSSEWLSYLRREFEQDAALSTEFKLYGSQLDMAVLMSQERPLTQRAATIISKLRYEGIFYQSRQVRI